MKNNGTCPCSIHLTMRNADGVITSVNTSVSSNTFQEYTLQLEIPEGTTKIHIRFSITSCSTSTIIYGDNLRLTIQ